MKYLIAELVAGTQEAKQFLQGGIKLKENLVIALEGNGVTLFHEKRTRNRKMHIVHNIGLEILTNWVSNAPCKLDKLCLQFFPDQIHVKCSVEKLELV